MEKLKISCNNCGNNLVVTYGIRFITCNQCKSSLEIVNTESLIYTKPTSSILNQEKFELPIQYRLGESKEIYKQIEILDREWNNNLPNYMLKGTLPNTNGILDMFQGIFGVMFGIFWTFFASSIFPPFLYVGIIITIISIWSLMNHSIRRQNYLKAKTKYERKRRYLLSKINNYS